MVCAGGTGLNLTHGSHVFMMDLYVARGFEHGCNVCWLWPRRPGVFMRHLLFVPLSTAVIDAAPPPPHPQVVECCHGGPGLTLLALQLW